MVYQDGQFCLCVPFSFLTYVIPVASDIVKREKKSVESEGWYWDTGPMQNY